MIATPDCLLFAQHGWADSEKAIAQLARALATSKTLIITPSLDYVKTWITINPLIQTVEQKVITILQQYPDIPIKIIGHSMGGLIWLEVLNRHPEWWTKVHSFVLIASPIGGADLARILDPLAIGLGIAKDLGINRRLMAKKIAQEIPTLVIAGDLDGGSDGTIPVESTKFAYSQFICLPQISHAALRNHPDLIEIIATFWSHPIKADLSEVKFSEILVERLRLIPGMTDAHWRDFKSSKDCFVFKDGTKICVWNNPLQIQHIFVANQQVECLYAGFVGWMHRKDLERALIDIRRDFATLIKH